mmetsp:Transcript_57776/g.135093  ORF Transcript_57776/g.135093 Transcript_57776/m.135093 type:complete len:166 (-) Transcript_57776:128-625(-)
MAEAAQEHTFPSGSVAEHNFKDRPMELAQDKSWVFSSKATSASEAPARITGRGSTSAVSKRPASTARPSCPAWTFGSSHLFPAHGHEQGAFLQSSLHLQPILEDQELPSEGIDSNESDSRSATPMFIPGIRDHSTQIPGKAETTPHGSSPVCRDTWAFGCAPVDS